MKLKIGRPKKRPPPRGRKGAGDRLYPQLDKSSISCGLKVFSSKNRQEFQEATGLEIPSDIDWSGRSLTRRIEAVLETLGRRMAGEEPKVFTKITGLPSEAARYEDRFPKKTIYPILLRENIPQGKLVLDCAKINDFQEGTGLVLPKDINWDACSIARKIEAIMETLGRRHEANN